MVSVSLQSRRSEFSTGLHCSSFHSKPDSSEHCQPFAEGALSRLASAASTAADFVVVCVQSRIVVCLHEADTLLAQHCCYKYMLLIAVVVFGVFERTVKHCVESPDHMDAHTAAYVSGTTAATTAAKTTAI
jgi:hypothetical protein